MGERESMVEKVARALRPDCFADGMEGSYAQKWVLEQARAAIQAMREPTGEMKDAGADSYGKTDYWSAEGGIILAGQPSKAWRAMIDAALAEQPDQEPLP